MELPKGDEYHRSAIRLNSGKNCLAYLLLARKYKKVYIPYFTCRAVLQPFIEQGVAYEFYHIDGRWEMAREMELKAGEALLYTNYFGLKQRYVEALVRKYGRQLIVDNTQAFYAKPLPGIDTFYTCRKFFGVPDGAYLYCDIVPGEEIPQGNSFHRFGHLLKRIDISAGEGFDDFHKNEEELGNEPILFMSKLSQRLMESINYHETAQRRRANYELLHSALQSTNDLDLPLEDAIPMVYPYLTEEDTLRQRLISEKIFIPTYWPNVFEWCRPEEREYLLAQRLCCLPIDQRYDKEEMRRILEVIIQ